MQAHGTTQPQAYDFYLRGRGYLQEYDRSESLDNAIAAFQRSLEADPKFALAYAGLGKAYMHKYDRGHLPDLIKQAKVECSTATELDSNIADGEICLGMLFNTTGEYEQAAQHLQRAVKLDPSRDESYGELARAYEGLREPDRAEALFKTAIALRPQHWAGHKWLGRFYAAHGRYDEAAEQFKRVVELAPDSYSGYSNLGAIYDQQGKYAEAAFALERSIAIRPTAPALNNLGALYFYQHKYLQAARSYEFAVQLSPNDYTMFGNLGEAYGQVEGRQEESHKNYNRALELAELRLAVNAKDGRILSAAALYAAMLDQKAKAEAYRKAALKLSAKDPQVRLNSALVLSQLRQDSLALSELDRALHAGLPATEVINHPAWQRFAADPNYKAMIARVPSKVTN
jgi:tetratricopeptide (TPR) repeat protein